MDKQLQLFTYKASLGLSFSLLLINQIAAQADTASDKTQWLASSINEVKKSSSDTTKITLKALSAKADSPAQTDTFNYFASDHAIKMRPFKANRKLPSRHELELALIEQKAKLAEETNSRLNGQVSTFIVGAENNNQTSIPQHQWNYTNNIQPTNNKKYSSKNYAEQSLAKSRQSNFTFFKQAEQHLLSTNMQHINETSPANISSSIAPTLSSMLPMAAPTAEAILPPSMPPSPVMPESLPQQIPGETFSSNFNSPTNYPSPPTSTLNNSQTATAGFGSAGPPPFPLNLLPESTLKQLIRSLAGGSTGSRLSTAPRTYFGSWHSASPNNNTAHYNNLSYGGFQSHLTSTRNPSANYKISALPAVTGSPIRSQGRHEKAHQVSTQKDTAARNRMLLESQVKVASYPAYATQSLHFWNFAQY